MFKNYFSLAQRHKLNQEDERIKLLTNIKGMTVSRTLSPGVSKQAFEGLKNKLDTKSTSFRESPLNRTNSQFPSNLIKNTIKHDLAKFLFCKSSPIPTVKQTIHNDELNTHEILFHEQFSLDDLFVGFPIPKPKPDNYANFNNLLNFNNDEVNVLFHNIDEYQEQPNLISVDYNVREIGIPTCEFTFDVEPSYMMPYWTDINSISDLFEENHFKNSFISSKSMDDEDILADFLNIQFKNLYEYD